ncbi:MULTISPECIES: DMT family transporter [Rhodopseudomonas]|uniref:ABC transporter permease n=1 Tax=Rhodopseudomonas palustris TaxID=1076 RepID=A0A0D7E109_RHOPL|nr:MULTISPECIES: DMT family transporter [Rhodopseudomonas]KIZ34170.1 ABC transporter permease [Rhodopseudomonas palustris]MDF3809218.1 DMT family transporter [Rhodopseudomonas sp. BAL398]WOK19098.1 DMT family transporter [Rhodopseudomonas sp. BAL398]
MATTKTAIDPRDWLLLVLLSVLWGGSFFFTGVAVRDTPPLTIVLVRVALAAAVLIPVMWIYGAGFPPRLRDWWPFLVMAVLNNVIPFTLLVIGQTLIPSGLASVLNATTPLFTILVMAAFREEALSARRVAGALLGVFGVVVLRGQGIDASYRPTLGILLCLGAALSYGFAGLWGRRKLAGISPLTSATCQLSCSSLVMLVLAGSIEWPHGLSMPGAASWIALLAFALLSTALAYLVFFQILVRSGASNVMLVTLLIPITAILLGHFVLGETLRGREIAGGLIIASALLVIDGRVVRLIRLTRKMTRP